jgi:hypothetical protein
MKVTVQSVTDSELFNQAKLLKAWSKPVLKTTSIRTTANGGRGGADFQVQGTGNGS